MKTDELVRVRRTLWAQHQGFKAVTAVSWGFGAVLGMR